MLHIITSLDDAWIELVKDDPVRPQIPREFRVGPHAQIFVLLDPAEQPAAVVCCAYRTTVPRSEQELAAPQRALPTVAVFYTIWSYQRGSGRRLIRAAGQWISHNRREIRKFVTLSPATETAKEFHLANGAGILSVNTDSVNYVYEQAAFGTTTVQ
jgi:hypothetical protein